MRRTFRITARPERKFDIRTDILSSNGYPIEAGEWPRSSYSDVARRRGEMRLITERKKKKKKGGQKVGVAPAGPRTE